MDIPPDSQGYTDAPTHVAFDEYEFYREHFRDESASTLVQQVPRAHEESWKAVLLELQYARDALCHGGTDERLVAFFRAYRCIDWYRHQLASAIIYAFAEPFDQFFRNSDALGPRNFFVPSMLRALRDRVIEEATGSGELTDRLNAFFVKHGKVRNQIIHGVHVPSPEESESCFTDAVGIYNQAETTFHEVSPALLNI